MSHTSQPCEKVFLSVELHKMLSSLPEDHEFNTWINELGDLLLSDREVGIKIPRKKFPKEYVDKHRITNLFKFDHPGYYRSCYTLFHDPDIGICARILGLYSHPEYDDLFGYR